MWHAHARTLLLSLSGESSTISYWWKMRAGRKTAREKRQWGERSGGGEKIRRRNRELFANLCVYGRERENQDQEEMVKERNRDSVVVREWKSKRLRERKRDRGREGSQTEGDTQSVNNREREGEKAQKRERKDTNRRVIHNLQHTICTFMCLPAFNSFLGLISLRLCVCHIYNLFPPAELHLTWGRALNFFLLFSFYPHKNPLLTLKSLGALEQSVRGDQVSWVNDLFKIPS